MPVTRHLIVPKDAIGEINLEEPEKIVHQVYRSCSLGVKRGTGFDVAVAVRLGNKLLGGLVEQRDYNSSIDPIYFRAKRVLIDAKMKDCKPTLERVRRNEDRVTFVFRSTIQT